MKNFLPTAILAFSSTVAFADPAAFDLSSMVLPKAETALDGKSETFFRTLFVSNGKIIGDVLNADVIPNDDHLPLVEHQNYCELRLAFSFFGQPQLGKFSLPEIRLSLNGTIENAFTLTGTHCRHDDAEPVRQSSLYNMAAQDRPGFPTTDLVVGANRMLIFPIGTFCQSHYLHSELPSESSLDSLKKGFGDLIQLQ